MTSRHLEAAMEMGADFVAQSFVRRAEDVGELRDRLGGRPVRVIAKVETRGAVQDAGRILESADGIMVARGDLGAGVPYDEVPLIQKELIRRAQAAGKPTIVATQMLESMIHSPRPTRAEVSDVANAVLDGAEGVLLSAETALGAYPVEAGRAASRIIETVERYQSGSSTGLLAAG